MRYTSDETCVGSPTRQNHVCRGTISATLLCTLSINSARYNAHISKCGAMWPLCPPQPPPRFGYFRSGGYCLNIFLTELRVCFSSPFWVLEMLSTVA